MYQKFGLFISGSWNATTNSTAVISPVTAKTLGEVATASSTDTYAALDAAAAAQEPLQRIGGFSRARELHRAADEMLRRSAAGARMISLETGKPFAQAEREWSLACDQFRWYAEEARRIYGRIVESRVPGGRFEITQKAIGVVGAFTAWNFPAALPARKLAPALAAGCPVVLRPSSQTPGVAMLIMDCLATTELPDGAVNLVLGPTNTTYDPIMADPRVRKVSLTGSTRVGQQMIRDSAATVKKVSMELGGNAPLIVYDDADLTLALNLAVPTKFANSGQVCVTPDRFFIHESLHDEFVAGFVERTAKITLGDGLDPVTDMGPLISDRRREQVETLVNDAITTGATLAYGGKRVTGDGFFFEPTVLTDVTDKMTVFAEENFGPIAAITTFSEDEEVLARANSSEAGLSAYAFTRSPERARRTAMILQSGMIGINSFALAASEAPFGGSKYSGMGREGGREGIEDYLETTLTQIVW